MLTSSQRVAALSCPCGVMARPPGSQQQRRRASVRSNRLDGGDGGFAGLRFGNLQWVQLPDLNGWFARPQGEKSCAQVCCARSCGASEQFVHSAHLIELRCVTLGHLAQFKQQAGSAHVQASCSKLLWRASYSAWACPCLYLWAALQQWRSSQPCLRSARLWPSSHSSLWCVLLRVCSPDRS